MENQNSIVANTHKGPREIAIGDFIGDCNGRTGTVTRFYVLPDGELDGDYVVFEVHMEDGTGLTLPVNERDITMIVPAKEVE